MKKHWICLYIVAILLPVSVFPQTSEITDSAKAVIQTRINLVNLKIKQNGYKWVAGVTSKSFLTDKEMSRLDGINSDTTGLHEILKREDSLFQQYKSLVGLGSNPLITLTQPNWLSYMSRITDQVTCGNCWAHAAAAVAEGALQSFYGSVPGDLGIALNIDDITNNASCGSGCLGTTWLPCGLYYIYSNKVSSTQGINVFPNYDKGYYTISSYSNNSVSIAAIKNALLNSPVLAEMTVYDDFYDYTLGIYQHTSGAYRGYHAVVILGYDDANQCWICRNSWGTGWGEVENGTHFSEHGYFRIKYGECGIDALGNVTASVTSSNCLAKLIPNFQTLSGAFSSSFVNNETAYALSNASTVSNITIPSNANFHVNPGITLSFGSGASINVNGILNATNATFDKSGSSSWGGIVFNSGSSGSLSVCTIQHASWGITCNGVLPSMSNCNLNWNTIGLYLNNLGSTSATISGNSFYNNSGHGISCYYSSPHIDANYLTHNLFAGIFCIGSSPQISNNGFMNNIYGIYLVNNSPATIGGYNYMIGNNSAIYAESQCNVYSYTSDVYSYGYAVQANYSAVVIAQNNYWGQYPPNSLDFSATNGANIYYLPGSATRWTKNLPQNIQSDNIQNNDPAAFSLDQNLLNAAKFMAEGKHNEAIGIYNNEFQSRDSTSVAKKEYLLAQLAECYRATKKDGFIDFLNNQVRPHISKSDEIYATTLELENLFLIRDKIYDKAIENLNMLKTNYAAIRLTNKFALFNLGYIYYELLYDKLKGKEYFDELKSKYPDDELTLECKFIFGEVDSSATANSFELAKEEAKNSIKQGSPNNYELFANYPNPFNPSTSIQYNIPKAGNVSLKIYDILGKEIVTLVNENKTEGYYEVRFDASKYPSGIYIYQLRINDYISSKKMILIK